MQLGDLFRVHFAERTADNGKILRERIRQASLHLPVSRDHAVAGDVFRLHAEIAAPVFDQQIQFGERPSVEQQIQAFPRRQFAAFVLFLDALCSASGGGFGLFLV